jgi:hypothetical protein
MARWWMRRFGRRVAARWALAADETRHLTGGRRGPVEVRVEKGLLLVTREGDPCDHVLAAGGEAIFPPDGRIVAWALEPALAVVAEVAPRPGAVGARVIATVGP